MSDTQSLLEGASSFAAHMRTCTTALSVAEEATAEGSHVRIAHYRNPDRDLAALDPLPIGP